MHQTEKLFREYWKISIARDFNSVDNKYLHLEQSKQKCYRVDTSYIGSSAAMTMRVQIGFPFSIFSIPLIYFCQWPSHQIQTHLKRIWKWIWHKTVEVSHCDVRSPQLFIQHTDNWISGETDSDPNLIFDDAYNNQINFVIKIVVCE